MILNDPAADKEELFNQVETFLVQSGISILSKDMSRPWGGFFVVDPESLDLFIKQFFHSKDNLKHSGQQTLSPKILVVEPDKRLSWQYHHRRSEIWSVIHGPVGIIKSDTDHQGDLITLNEKDQIELQKGERHRLIGLEEWGVIAEIWQHTDPEHPSDEDDIVRLEDDFGR
jgi:mannose-6-phosphate isomerase